MEEFIVRYLRLRPPKAEADALSPDWAAVSCTRRPPDGEEFHLCWLADDGHCLGWEDFDTLPAALDWAAAAAGIRPGEWRECRVAIRSEDGSIAWSDLATALQPIESAQRLSPGSGAA